jgi:uncharacterized protein (TIGR02594 family)
MSRPPWLITAESYIGTREVKGPKTATVIEEWLQRLGAWWADDEAPWCGAFVAAVMQRHGYPVPRYWMRAKAWIEWGMQIQKPVLGCIVIFERQGGGHVGFVVGRRSDGYLWVLGGNQADAVRVSLFSPARVVGYRLPRGFDYRLANGVPLVNMAGVPSVNEG